MRILITGGAGFIGSHLTGLLSSETVTILDDLSAGRLENIPDDANFVCCDVKSPLARDVVKNGHFDAIVHLAAQTMVPASMEDPKKDMKDNIEGTVNILEAARKYGVKRIIFSSSAAVYGDIAPECLPVRETEPLRPVSFYGLSKMTCENYIRLYQKAYGLSYVIFRFANVYGERQGNGGEGGVVSIFARQLAEGKSPTVYGNGQQTRDFIYAGDIANGIRKALFSETANITCNLSTGREVTVKDAADRLLRLSGLSKPICHAAAREGDIFRSALCSQMAGKYLGWAPETDWQKGLERTYFYFEKEYRRERNAMPPANGIPVAGL